MRAARCEPVNRTVKSEDGTTIAHEVTGAGPTLILVVGAFCDGGTFRALARLLAPQFTVCSYDRRGRGDSGDTPPYTPQREVEDLDALITAAGGSAMVYGHSSGGALALDAAARGLAITRLAVYEPPYQLDEDREGPPDDLAARVQAEVHGGRPEQAAELFLADVPAEVMEMIKQSPDWPRMVGVAHTLPYDLAVVGDGPGPIERLARITVPTLAMAGGASPGWFRNTVAAVAAAIPGARELTLEGQDHGVADDVIAPVLMDFFR